MYKIIKLKFSFRNTLFWLKKTVKKGYCGNKSLSLAWDCVKVCQFDLFNTTCEYALTN